MQNLQPRGQIILPFGWDSSAEVAFDKVVARTAPIGDIYKQKHKQQNCIHCKFMKSAIIAFRGQWRNPMQVV
jgi:hypothetical protein